jgi:hypothetical protein
MQQDRTPTESHVTPPSTPAPVPGAPALGLEPHLFDRLAVLYKYRWASIGVFLLVIGWVMVDSYTRCRCIARWRAC